MTKNRLIVNVDQEQGRIDKHVYGHFSEHLGRCIYGGYWVGEGSPIPNTRGIRKDIVNAFRAIRVPNIRWPGGCFADEYHWMDGIGPREKRPSMINTHWGGVTENNHFGTHEFLDLCEQVGCEPYICGNLGSGTVREMSQWVEYVNSDNVSPMADLRRANGREKAWGVKFWGVGNENWGCGGWMRPEFYADQYRRYACYCRNYPPHNLYRIACGPCGASYDWTETLMKMAGGFMQGLALHYYCGTGKRSASATKFEEYDWAHNLKNALQMDELITRHSAIMDRYDPAANVALVVDEWGAWHMGEPGTNPAFLHQQNSMRDALVAGLTLNIFNRHARRVRIANIAQTVNVLQAIVLTEGAKMILTPTYHVFDLYQGHQDAALLASHLEAGEYACEDIKMPSLSASASRKGKRVLVTLCNVEAAKAQDLAVDLRGVNVRAVKGRVVTAGRITAHNTFTKPDAVEVEAFGEFKKRGATLAVRLPARSVVALDVSVG